MVWLQCPTERLAFLSLHLHPVLLHIRLHATGAAGRGSGALRLRPKGSALNQWLRNSSIQISAMPVTISVEGRPKSCKHASRSAISIHPFDTWTVCMCEPNWLIYQACLPQSPRIKHTAGLTMLFHVERGVCQIASNEGISCRLTLKWGPWSFAKVQWMCREMLSHSTVTLVPMEKQSSRLPASNFDPAVSYTASSSTPPNQHSSFLPAFFSVSDRLYKVWPAAEVKKFQAHTCFTLVQGKMAAMQ